MATYIIGFDLNKEGAGYSERNKALSEAIQALSGTFWHHLDSTWIIVSDQTAAQIRDTLKPCLDANDELLVALSGNVGAWHGFNDRGSAWLKKNL